MKGEIFKSIYALLLLVITVLWAGLSVWITYRALLDKLAVDILAAAGANVLLGALIGWNGNVGGSLTKDFSSIKVLSMCAGGRRALGGQSAGHSETKTTPVLPHMRGKRLVVARYEPLGAGRVAVWMVPP